VLVRRALRAVEEHAAALFHQDGGKVLHLQVADLLGVVLDVEPAELGLRELRGQREEAFLVGDAAVAPKRAKAGHAEFVHAAIRLPPCPIGSTH
jgi:hypothetical protein